MQPHYLSFPDLDTANKELASAGLADLDKSGQVVGYQLNVDLIGMNPSTHIGQCLVNILWDDEVELLPKNLVTYEVFPKTPMQVFAGWSPEEIAARNTK